MKSLERRFTAGAEVMSCLWGRKDQRDRFSVPCEMIYRSDQLNTQNHHAPEEKMEERSRSLVRRIEKSDKKFYKTDYTVP